MDNLASAMLLKLHLAVGGGTFIYFDDSSAVDNLKNELLFYFLRRTRVISSQKITPNHGKRFNGNPERRV